MTFRPTSRACLSRWSVYCLLCALRRVADVRGSRYIQERIHMSKELAQRAQTQRATDTQQPIRAVNRVRLFLVR